MTFLATKAPPTKIEPPMTASPVWPIAATAAAFMPTVLRTATATLTRKLGIRIPSD